MWKALKPILIITIFVVGIVGTRFYFLWRERNAPSTMQGPPRAERRLTADDVVQPRKMYMNTLADAKALAGTTVWVQAGFTLDYYPYATHHVDFAHPAGVLPGVTPLAVKEVVEQKTPANLATRIPQGNKQVFVVFTMPNDEKTYATAIGYVQGSDEKYYCDDIFYYDDPHKMYSFWGAEVWQAVDQHIAKPGMNELQTAMSLGMIQQSDASTIGDRTVHYDVGGKKWTVTFQNDKATSVQQQ
ncbi:hypothetical protein [Silvibacterium dinghuense]|uniref:Uncharacterized protein n=1 Tax=Silvibacterium dinghuense TaxID=1560006 RepID=A0A4Q1SJV7_9BACT|nr:hypothetical protein [Silvibacterium dinghuense]RXS97727.1 hypothetical protein ESZ00_07610 [Silvibacterium dinghuense]GGH01484.1 hypothetical protein GCM10011586_16420 [Silvibacterium dinghuense]